MPITSPKNPLLQDVRRAARSGKRTESGLIVAEGPHLLEEALRGTWNIEQVLVEDGAQELHRELLGKVHAEVVSLPGRAFRSLTTTQSPQGVITMLRPRIWDWKELEQRSPALLLALDGIQDPGNAGTLVRSAEAFGATGVLFLPGSVGIGNGKLLRAAAGSLFRMPLLENVSTASLLDRRRSGGLHILAFAAGAENTILETDLTVPTVLVLGSEGAGVSAAIAQTARRVQIPVFEVESLNVGVAGSIALFEAARQRRNRSL